MSFSSEEPEPGSPSASVHASVAEAASFLGPLALYVWTLAPTVTVEDSGEFIAAAVHLGVLHPPGYPLWTLIAHGFTRIPGLDPAVAVHLCSAVFGSLTCWLTFRIARELTGHVAAALIAALALGASRTLWSQSVIAEVYGLNAFLVSLSFLLVLRWRATRRRGFLYALAFTTGLGLTNHFLVGLFAPVFAVWCLSIDHREVLRPKVLAVGGLLLTLGLSIYLYLPIRASAAPPVNIGNPDSFERTLAHIRRDVYSVEAETRYRGDVGDWAAHTAEAGWRSARALGWPLAAVALFGAFGLARRRPGAFWSSAAIVVLNTAVLNAVLGALHNEVWAFVHRVYYIPAQVMMALWLAEGCREILDRADHAGGIWKRSATAAFALGVAASAALNLPHTDHRGHRVARDFALDLLDSAPEGSGFLGWDDEVAFPLTYIRHVEGIRPDVTVLDEGLGWDGEQVAALMSASPISPAMVDGDPVFAQLRSVPRGLAYQLVPRARVPKQPGYGAFQPLPNPPRDSDLERVKGNFFGRFIRARYACYYARLGAKQRTALAEEAAEGSWARAEALADGDPYVTVVLVEIYRHFGIRAERLRPMLEAALDAYDRILDPQAHRFYPVSREEIAGHLDALARGRPFPPRFGP